MRYVPLGTTGVQVSPLCLGTMMFGAWGNPDHEACVRIIHRALDVGINFIDTADVYSAGESEEIVGEALKASRGRRDDVVLATKFHAPVGPGPNDRGNNRKHIFRAVEDSLRRLGTDYIDLYQAHRPDPATDVADTLGALSALVHQGKVRWIGSSTFPAREIVEAQWAAERRQRERFVCEQPPYSILVRNAELEVLPTCTRHGMGVIVWSPLAGGWLSGKYRKGKPVEAAGRAVRSAAGGALRERNVQATRAKPSSLYPLREKPAPSRMSSGRWSLGARAEWTATLSQFGEYETEGFYDEIFEPGGGARRGSKILVERIDELSEGELLRRQHAAEAALLNLGITFNIYGAEGATERIFPFDLMPRIIEPEDWLVVERGLEQRVTALNAFCDDIYHDQKIVADGVVPEEIIRSASGYLPECQGLNPPRGVWCHITGSDLVRDADGQFYVLEDNLRCPSGVSYVLENRQILKRTFPHA